MGSYTKHTIDVPFEYVFGRGWWNDDLKSIQRGWGEGGGRGRRDGKLPGKKIQFSRKIIIFSETTHRPRPRGQMSLKMDCITVYT
jgi:hypothetical protein